MSQRQGHVLLTTLGMTALAGAVGGRGPVAQELVG